MKIMSYNIKGAFHFDDERLEWENRKDYIFQVINRQHPTLLGIQEMQDVQLKDFKENLTDYEFFGEIRSDEVGSERSTIGYLKEKMELLESDTFWLSDTPEVMSKTESWKAACYRVVTWGKFKEKSTGKVFTYMNTHFDHTNEYPRYKAAGLVTKFMASHEGPFLLTGDFNGEPYERFYEILTQNLKDLVLDSPHHVGPMKTCNMLEVGDPFLCDKVARIDYIFGSKEVKVLQTEICTDSFCEFHPSDHYPVVAEIQL